MLQIPRLPPDTPYSRVSGKVCNFHKPPVSVRTLAEAKHQDVWAIFIYSRTLALPSVRHILPSHNSYMFVGFAKELSWNTETWI